MDDEATEAEMARMAAQIPHLVAVAEPESHAVEDPTLGWCDSRTEFELTLDLLLGGLAARSRRLASGALPREMCGCNRAPRVGVHLRRAQLAGGGSRGHSARGGRNASTTAAMSRAAPVPAAVA